MSESSDSGEEKCGVRDKYTKLRDKVPHYFQLYTTYSKPGLISIFSYDDQRSFHNWGFEVGTGQKRGRIREVIDHQISTPVLEISGHHGGSVHMACPPEAESNINVDMPYVTLLMRDILGYASVEFRVLDSLGFSRKICAKNFKSRCVIGELNCEIPMRLSPTWNYACVNLDETLQNAFGTRLISVQRIKINANLRIRRIYFHDEIFPFRTLPQEFRIKLKLSNQEKLEIKKYEEFMSNEPGTTQEQNIPWIMGKLTVAKGAGVKFLRLSTANNQSTTIRKHQFEIMEVPLKEEDSDKYTNINAVGKVHPASNTGLLREMLHKSIPPSKILLPTLSLIYPENRVYTGRLSEQGGGNKRGTKFNNESNVDVKCEGAVNETTDQLRKMKRCIELQKPPIIETGPKIYVEFIGEENDNSRSSSLTPQQNQTDWDKFHSHEHGHGHEHSSRHESHIKRYSENSHHHHHHEQHHHHHSPHGCGKYSVAELAQYLKYREVFGDYDMFTATLGNERFLEPPLEEPEEETDEDGEFGESEEGSNSDEEGSEGDEQDMRSEYGHGPENPFLRVGTPVSRRASSIVAGHAGSSSQSLYTGFVEKYAEVDGEGNEEHGIQSVKSTESWLPNSIQNKTTAKDISQSRLPTDDRMYSEAVRNMNNNAINKKTSKLLAVRTGGSFTQQHQRRVRSKPPPPERRPNPITELYRRAGPMLPQVMKQEFVNIARNSKVNLTK